MRVKKKATVKKGIVAININVERRGGREDIGAAKSTTYGFDVFIFTGPIARWRIRKADREENEEVEVSRRQLRKLHKLWGVLPV